MHTIFKPVTRLGGLSSLTELKHMVERMLGRQLLLVDFLSGKAQEHLRAGHSMRAWDHLLRLGHNADNSPPNARHVIKLEASDKLTKSFPRSLSPVHCVKQLDIAPPAGHPNSSRIARMPRMTIPIEGGSMTPRSTIAASWPISSSIGWNSFGPFRHCPPESDSLRHWQAP